MLSDTFLDFRGLGIVPTQEDDECSTQDEAGWSTQEDEDWSTQADEDCSTQKVLGRLTPSLYLMFPGPDLAEELCESGPGAGREIIFRR